MESADVARLTDELLPKLYYFCLKKTSDRGEAEDLTQDIALQVLTALRGGRQPENFSAYVWKIARNRYAAWADGKRRRRAAADVPEQADSGDTPPEARSWRCCGGNWRSSAANTASCSPRAIWRVDPSAKLPPPFLFPRTR